MATEGDGIMSVQFWPCPGCSRHVKRGDAICPFCGATPSVEIGPTRVLAGRLSRAALFAAGAMGTVVATTACGGKESTAPDSMASAGSSSGASAGSGSQYAGSGGVLYGGPIPIETEDSSASSGCPLYPDNPSFCSGSLVYGAPPFPIPVYGGSGVPVPNEIEDSSASDGPSEVAADAADAGAPTDSASTSDAPSTDGSIDATDASATTMPTDSSSATDVPTNGGGVADATVDQ
jgi:hypothetical protein